MVRRQFFRWTRVIVVAYLLFLLLVTFLETWLVYPAPPVSSGDWVATALDREDVWIATDGGAKLHGWYLEHPNPRHVILYCHGNGEHVAHCGPRLDELRRQYQASVLVFDYRGYGKSAGTPFETHLVADGLAAQRWLAQRAGIGTDEVIIIGRSLGGGVAIACAEVQGAKAMVLQSTFARMVDTAAQLKPYLPVRLLMRNRWDSLARIAAYEGPVLQSHGQHDTLITLAEGRRLFDAIPSQQKKFITFDGGHNGGMPRSYYDALEEFLSRHALPDADTAAHAEPQANLSTP
jgi:uncharacterized protein